MNYKTILYTLGIIFQAEGGFLLLPFLCGLFYQEYWVSLIYFVWGNLCFWIGTLLSYRKPEDTSYTPKDAMVITALSWILISLLGSVPFILAGEITNPIDAFFETVSGFTTTGSTIIPNLDLISKASLFWRSFTHWIGGMGVLVFLLAFLPTASATFMNLMVAESPGPEVSKLVPKVKDTAKSLYKIYFWMTIVQLLLLLAAQMPIFDAITLTMGTAGTGGFAVRSTGFDDYTVLQQFIIAVFMMLFGINFTFYFLVFYAKKWKEAWHMEEVRTYLAIIFLVTAVIGVTIHSIFPNWLLSFHHSFFTVASIITTTGYSTVDFNVWPTLTLVLVVAIMFVGACAGSTGGGIKVSRFSVATKNMTKPFRSILHPGRIWHVRMDHKPVPKDTIEGINTFFILYLVIFFVCFLIVSYEGKDLVTTFTAVAATLNNIGPGLGEVGPMGTFAGLSNVSKLTLSFAMLAGRLELLPMILLWIPSFWITTRKVSQRQMAREQEKK